MPSFTLDPIVEDEPWGIWQFIAQDNPEAATCVVEAAYETFARLAANPGLGRPRKLSNSRLLGIRSFRVTGFDNNLIFYRRIADDIQVLRVYHGARDLESLFDEG